MLAVIYHMSSALMTGIFTKKEQHLKAAKQMNTNDGSKKVSNVPAVPRSSISAKKRKQNIQTMPFRSEDEIEEYREDEHAVDIQSQISSSFTVSGLTEEEQLLLAIQASLQINGGAPEE